MAAATGDREEVVLETQDLRKHFGGVRAVNGLDLTIPYGDLRAIIGPNGEARPVAPAAKPKSDSKSGFSCDEPE